MGSLDESEKSEDDNGHRQREPNKEVLCSMHDQAQEARERYDDVRRQLSILRDELDTLLRAPAYFLWLPLTVLDLRTVESAIVHIDLTGLRLSFLTFNELLQQLNCRRQFRSSFRWSLCLSLVRQQ